MQVKTLKKNDLITSIGDNTVRNVAEYNKYLSDYSIGDIILLRILRNNSVRYEAFEIK